MDDSLVDSDESIETVLRRRERFAVPNPIPPPRSSRPRWEERVEKRDRNALIEQDSHAANWIWATVISADAWINS